MACDNERKRKHCRRIILDLEKMSRRFRVHDRADVSVGSADDSACHFTVKNGHRRSICDVVISAERYCRRDDKTEFRGESHLSESRRDATRQVASTENNTVFLRDERNWKCSAGVALIYRARLPRSDISISPGEDFGELN